MYVYVRCISVSHRKGTLKLLESVKGFESMWQRQELNAHLQKVFKRRIKHLAAVGIDADSAMRTLHGEVVRILTAEYGHEVATNVRMTTKSVPVSHSGLINLNFKARG